MDNDQTPVYEIAFNILVSWEAHSGSNVGSFGTNKLYPRKQALSNGIITDAITGNILKHFHSTLLNDYLVSANVPLCKPCSENDSRRVAALIGEKTFLQSTTIDTILTNCGSCDIHGFLITAKNSPGEDQSASRTRLLKHSVIEFSMALALPGKYYETSQVFARAGDSKEGGQMIYQMTARSGSYALGIRYFCAGIGQDTYRRRLVITSQEERRKRHIAVLSAIRDLLLSPVVALTSKLLPLLSGLEGVITLRKYVGRAPMYSALKTDYKEKLKKMADTEFDVIDFETVDTFKVVMDTLINTTEPRIP